MKITQKNVIFCYFVKFYSYNGKFQSSYETKKSMENDYVLLIFNMISLC